MNEDAINLPPRPEEDPDAEAIDVALADLRRALAEDEVVEKHYHVRAAMQRLYVLRERDGRR